MYYLAGKVSFFLGCVTTCRILLSELARFGPSSTVYKACRLELS